MRIPFGWEIRKRLPPVSPDILARAQVDAMKRHPIIKSGRPESDGLFRSREDQVRANELKSDEQ